MTYIPVIVPPQEAPSPRTRELADQLARVIVDFEQNHPTVEAGEIRQAAQLAVRASRTAGGVDAATITALVGLVVLVVGVVVYMGITGRFAVDGPFPVLLVNLILIAIVAVAAILLRRSRG